MTPAVIKRGGLGTEPLQAIELGLIVTLVDFKGKVMQGSMRHVDLFSAVLRKRALPLNPLPRLFPSDVCTRDRHRFVKQATDRSMATVTWGDLEEGDAVELLKNIEPNNIRVKLPGPSDIFDPENYFPERFQPRIHDCPF
jgi:hypothetical protein